MTSVGTKTITKTEKKGKEKSINVKRTKASRIKEKSERIWKIRHSHRRIEYFKRLQVTFWLNWQRKALSGASLVFIRKTWLPVHFNWSFEATLLVIYYFFSQFLLDRVSKKMSNFHAFINLAYISLKNAKKQEFRQCLLLLPLLQLMWHSLHINFRGRILKLI